MFPFVLKEFLAKTYHFEDLNVSPWAAGIHFYLLPVYVSLSLKVIEAIDLHPMNHQGPRFPAKNLSYYSTEEKKNILMAW